MLIVNAGLANISEVSPTLKDDIRMAQANDKILQGYLRRLQEGKT